MQVRGHTIHNVMEKQKYLYVLLNDADVHIVLQSFMLHRARGIITLSFTKGVCFCLFLCQLFI